MTYRICSRCVMDTSDPHITFDENGICNNCTRALKLMKIPPVGFDSVQKKQALAELVTKIKTEGRGKKYDCIIGISGGVDSSYVAHLVTELKLRPLAVHLDNGWNSELSVINIEKILRKLDIDLYTVVLDWDEFRDLQLSFLKASVPDIEIPTDHAIFATLYQVANKFNIKYILQGVNTMTESIGSSAWSNGHFDWRYIRFIQRKFGTKRLKSFPHLSPVNLAWYKLVRKIEFIPILDYIDYKKKDAIELLKKEYSYRPYSTKHGESTYTFFIQSFILPKKFNYDKRRGHLSNLIISGELMREKALDELKNNPCGAQELTELKEFVCDKFEISASEFEELMTLENKHYGDYPNYNNHKIYAFAKMIFKKYVGL
jgi:N-acetyl sugar amidotransferase